MYGWGTKGADMKVKTGYFFVFYSPIINKYIVCNFISLSINASGTLVIRADGIQNEGVSPTTNLYRLTGVGATPFSLEDDVTVKQVFDYISSFLLGLSILREGDAVPYINDSPRSVDVPAVAPQGVYVPEDIKA
ncbi:hypothetical protein B7939_13400, partial [Eggerthia catenaformis]